MSSLAFDKQGKPFRWHRLARYLAVRVFSNPGGRGSCFPVHDKEGNEVQLDVDAGHAELREAVDNRAGQYRLDQLDENGQPIAEAPPAYAIIHDARNQGERTDVRDMVLASMAESNAQLAQTNAEVTKEVAARFADVMHATAALLHSPIKPLVIEKESDGECDCDECQRARTAQPPPEPEPVDPWAAWRPIVKMAEPHLPQLGAFLYAQVMAFLNKNATPPPAAAPSQHAASAAAPAPAAAPQPEQATAGAAAGSSAPPTSAPPTPSAASAPSTSPVSSAPPATPPAPLSTSLAAVPATGESAPRNAPTTAATTTAPTPEQWAHLAAIRECLSPGERAIAERAIVQMSGDGDALAQWLAALSTMSIEDAVRTLRAEIAKRRAHGSPDGG